MAVLGKTIIIKMDGKVIAGTRSDDIQTEADAHETSSPYTSKWRTYIAGRCQWGVTVNFLVMANSGIRDVLKVGNTYTLVIQDRNGGSTMTGDAILMMCKQTYTLGNLAQGTFQFVGDGELR